MPKRTDLHKILVIGSGPIVIGQAAEFDYAGSQACISLKEEGYQVVLVNSNPATIMTDDQIADQVYLEPLTVPSLTEIIELEHPDALLPTLGGQTGLNLAIELDQAGVLNKFGVTLLGTDLQTIQEAEDREQFKQLMEEIADLNGVMSVRRFVLSTMLAGELLYMVHVCCTELIISQRYLL